MAGVIRQKPITWNGEELFYNENGHRLRVYYDDGPKTHWLELNGKRIGSAKKIDKVAYLFFAKRRKILNDEGVVVKQYQIPPSNSYELQIRWFHVNAKSKDKELKRYLFKFYNEEDLLRPDEDGKIPDIESLIHSASQAAREWGRIEGMRDYIQKNPDCECKIYEIKGKEFYALYSKPENKPEILKSICEDMNDLYLLNCNTSREELKKEFEDSGMYTPDREDVAKEDWGEGNYRIISEETVNEHYSNNLYKTDGQTITVLHRQIDKQWVVDAFLQLLKTNPVEVSAMADIAELADIKVPLKS